MQARRADQFQNTHPDYAADELFPIFSPSAQSPAAQRETRQKLESAFRRAFKLLETWGLIEPAEGYNGKNGMVVLTEAGIRTTAQMDLEHFRQRRLLAPEMLHPLLRGDVYADFLAGKFGKAILLAFKLVEVRVRTAANLTDKEFGGDLIQVAFNEKNGPLTDMSESISARKALVSLFLGSLGRFRNPEAHIERKSANVQDAVEELMLASLLLRLVDQRSPRGT